jgi:formate hydrogenlyase subunit 6/NADH:ubiquinone oxidoreductase subunit I
MCVLQIWIGEKNMMKLGIIKKLFQNLFSKPMTVRFPHESIPIPKGYRGKHQFDKDTCISCKLCANICPNNAIEMKPAPEKFQDSYSKVYPEVDLGKCCFCRLCEDICPTHSLQLTDDCYLSTFDAKTTYVKPFEQASNDA